LFSFVEAVVVSLMEDNQREKKNKKVIRMISISNSVFGCLISILKALRLNPISMMTPEKEKDV
jgi:hypothetical protein